MMDMHPAGKWLVASAENWDQLRFWPLVKTYPSVVEGYSGFWKPVVFSPDGEWLATGWGDGFLRLWPVPTGESRELQVLEAPRASYYTILAFDRTGENLVTAGSGNNFSVSVVSLGGGTPRQLDGFPRGQMLFSTAFSPSGRLVAAGAGFGTGERKVLRVWDLETGEVRVFDLEGPPTEPEGIAESRAVETGWENCVFTVLFENESTLLTAGAGGVRRWNLETGTSEVVIQTAPEVLMSVTMSDDQAKLFTRAMRVAGRFEGVAVHHLTAGTSRALDLFGDHVRSFTTDPTGEVLVTGDMEGIVRVGRIDAGEPHLLLGHEQQVDGVAISPDLEWIVSAGQDETLRLWPMPDLSKPPLHTLPHDELIAKLKTLTNLRVVRDEDSPTGWKVEVGPFPGWETVPTW
jgi:WD40 repeat protein